ncbi:MAG: response regulator [Planctomycetes bacterium]|nr:response regulator [Planctomycetota bacterium]
MRVLLIEDDPNDAELVLRQLRHDGIEPVATVVRSRADLEANLAGDYDVIIADYRLPDLVATAALSRVRECLPDTPFIVVSGSTTEEQLLAMLRLGADDYLLKDRLGRLAASVRAAQERHRLRRERVAAESLAAQREVANRHLQRLESIGVLTGGIAHDFNNLMTVVLGSCEVALEMLAAEHPVRELLLSVLRAGRQASTLSRRLLSFARRETHGTQAIDLRPVIESFLALTRSSLGPRTRVEFTAGESLPTVEVDRTAIEQVLMNLLLNARDAMPHGGRIRVTMQRGKARSGFGDVLELAVADDGIGITAEQRRHLFEPFFTTKGPERGTGLGLSTSMEIVRHHGGDIEVDSTPGRGSEFRVVLPASIQPMKLRSPHEPGSGRSVLVVERDRSLQGALTKVLCEAGFAAVGFDTVGDIRVEGGPGSQPPAVVLTESGEVGTLVEWLTADPSRGPRRVVVMQDAGQPPATGPVEAVVLLRPFTAQQLVRVVQASCEASAVR